MKARSAELEANQFSTTTKLTGKSSLLWLMSLVMNALFALVRLRVHEAIWTLTPFLRTRSSKL